MDSFSGIDPGLAVLLEKAPGEEFDYGFVMECLSAYKNPRVKLNHLLKIKALIRVKKGIYIFGKNFARRPYSSEVLANLIYGPSYVSLEWACQYYRLIPEKVTTVTSITTKRSRKFQTPLGLFTYDHLPTQVFPVGVTLIQFSDRQQALVATKEKALADLLVLRRGSFSSKKHFRETLLEDLRIEEDDLDTLDPELLKAIYLARPHSAINYLIQCRNHRKNTPSSGYTRESQMEFKEKMAQGQPLYGVIVTLSSPAVCEILSESGFDWLWIDMEHAPLSLREVQEMSRAKNRDCTALVRIPANTEEWIKRVLDLGVDGIIIPHVNSAEEAECAVKMSLYPPEGSRSVGITRAGKYGMDAHYKQKANTKRLLFIQIEHREGVENIQKIVQVPGLDGIIIGPYDLSGSYGKPGQIEDAEIAKAIEKVLDTCKQYQKPAGIFAKDMETAKKYLSQGFQLVAIGADVHYLWSAAKATMDSIS